MTQRRLTKLVVDGLLPEAKDYVVWCAKLPGFGCRVRPSGHKTFVAMYRAGGRNSTPRKVTIGTYGKLTVEQARVEATRILARAELGDDVAAERARIRAELTVEELCVEYLREGIDKKRPSTVATDKSRIARHIVPLLLDAIDYFLRRLHMTMLLANLASSVVRKHRSSWHFVLVGVGT